ncbi:phosphatase [Leptolyngbya sp. 'hensonii']|uniref:alkaline phosphatase PhoX n=1 Tax=Leptolyngbya sp. 'hensonii' TaxID=1922337 RepID=UPI00094FF11E|nr:alkaline phosphatase PhoX [Leptolyngbya sp. 'hensonii']OLP18013.1 phosphatase [Leptolyngbya sp. 'hensonii']
MSFSRRKFLTVASASAAGVTMVSPLEAFYARVAQGQNVGTVGFGPLVPKPALNAQDLKNTILGDLSKEALLSLPAGFNYTVLSMTGMPMSDGTLVPAGHDGMAAFPGPNNTIVLVRNHELSSALPANYNYPVSGGPRYSEGSPGGTTTLVVGPDRKLQKHFVSLAGSRTNCAGGPTPWGTWITCEETFSTTTSNGTPVRHGYSFEVVADPNSGVVTPVPLVAMGRFSHEAIAVDPKTGYVYETEDRGDSCFYRFIPAVGKPTKPGDLAMGGTLYALKVKDKPKFNTTNNPFQGGTPGLVKVGETLSVEWVQIDNPDPNSESASTGVGVRYEAQAKGAATFFRGEGCWYGNGLIYFVATQSGPPAVQNLPSPPGNGRGNGQVWAYNPAKETLTLVVEAAASGTLLDEPDNVTVTPFGDLFLCEDSSDDFQYIVGVNAKGELYQFAQNTLFSKVTNDPAKQPFVGNEFAGACFSPDGQTLFVNIQTPGLTFAIWGPWARKGRSR